MPTLLEEKPFFRINAKPSRDPVIGLAILGVKAAILTLAAIEFHRTFGWSGWETLAMCLGLCLWLLAMKDGSRNSWSYAFIKLLKFGGFLAILFGAAFILNWSCNLVFPSCSWIAPLIFLVFLCWQSDKSAIRN